MRRNRRRKRKELNGFKLPRSRTITEAKVNANPFKKARTIAGNPPFVEHTKRSFQLDSSYLRKLQSQGVPLDQEQLQWRQQQLVVPSSFFQGLVVVKPVS